MPVICMRSSLLIFALFLLLFSRNAAAEVDDGTAISSESLSPLAHWVEHATHIRIQTLPLAIASDRKLEKALHIENVQRAGAVGAYLPGQIIISSSIWDPDTIQAQSYVVHELVHHAQLIGGHVYPCNAAKEREAYMLQSRWLIEHGQKPIVDQAWIDSISSCRAVGRSEDKE